MYLNDYLNISNYRSKEFEYKVTFKDEKEFYQDIKNQNKLYWWFGDGINECNIELANVVSGFIRPHLPPYTKLILKTIYLKYQRQERPTMDCRASLLESYVNQFDYDHIEVPYLHNYPIPSLYPDILILIQQANKKENKTPFYNYQNKPNKIICTAHGYYIQADCIILPDEGAQAVIFPNGGFLIGRPKAVVPSIKKNVPIICNKKRTLTGVKTIMPEIDVEGNDFAIVDDIITGGDSIINVVKLLRIQRPKAKITIYCIFLMSQYGYDNIIKQCGDVEIKPIFDLRNKINFSKGRV